VQIKKIWRLSLRHIPLLVLLLSICQCTRRSSTPLASKTFSVQLFQEPQQLNPQRLLSSSANYFFYNLLRGLYKIDSSNQAVSEGGLCHWIGSKKLRCHLHQRFWSDGTPVTPKDYIRAAQNLVDPKSAAPRAYLLSKLVNATEISQGHLPTSELGVRAADEQIIEFLFTEKDPNFLYTLASSALYPLHKNYLASSHDYRFFVGNGPYQIKSWKAGHKIELEANPHYPNYSPEKPRVEFYFVEDEMTAYRLYETKKLSFLRRAPTALQEQIQDRPDYHKIPMARFDYIGFAGALKDQLQLRQALIHSVDYDQLKKVLHTNGRPGCPSLPSELLDSIPCHSFNLDRAKQLLAKVPSQALASTYVFKFSKMGGEDIKKQVEFIQSQWKKHLSLNIEIQPTEQKIMTTELSLSPPDIFRRGVGLESPTCLEALLTFASEHTPAPLDLSQTPFMDYINLLKVTDAADQQKVICRQANQFLLDNAQIIPLGEMHFNVLADPHFRGWTLNSLNQLDLSQLTYSP
jgi:oligopeptide transport system substrate-binding protein